MTANRSATALRAALVYLDVEGARAIWSRDPEVAREASARCEAVWRGLVERHAGQVLRAQGDHAVLRFAQPVAAVQFAVALQRALRDAEWPPALGAWPEAADERRPDGTWLHHGLRVRLGIQHGPAGPRAELGPHARSAARLSGLVAGGGVIAGADVWAAVEEAGLDVAVRATAGVRFSRAFGALDVVEIQPPELAARLGRSPRPGEPAEALLGRDADLAALGELMQLGVRVVTVVGPAGIGKSALVRAHEALLGAGHTVRVDLAGATSTVDLDHGLATGLGIPLHQGQAGRGPVQQLAWALGARGRLVVILDGVDGVSEAVGDSLVTWVRTAPDVRFLLTARRRIGLDREVAYELAPLAATQGEPAREGPAVRLVLDRLRTLGATHRWTALERRELGIVADLLGGNPQWLLLLAGQLATDSIGRIHDALRIQLPEPDLATPADRGAAILSVVAGHLRPWERAALVRAAVFEGALDLDAAEAVFGLEQWPGAPLPVDVVDRLCDLGLLASVVQELPGARCYAVPSFVRDWVRRHAGISEREVAEGRHAGWHVRWGEAWAAEVDGPAGSEVLTRLATARRDLLAAIRNPISLRERTPARVNRALRLAAVVDAGLAHQGPGDVRVRVLDEVLGWSEEVDGVDPALVVRALLNRGEALAARSRWGDARVDLQRAQKLAAAVKDGDGEVAAWAALGQVLERSGDLSEALRVLSDAHALLEGASEREAARVLGRLGVVHLHLGSLERAEDLLLEAAELARIAGDRRGEAIHVGNLGVLRRRLGDLPTARAHYEDAVRAWRRVGDPVREAAILGNLSLLNMHQGRVSEARDEMNAALEVCRSGGDRWGEAGILTNLGLVEVDAGHLDSARALLQRAMAMNHDAGDALGEGVDAGLLGVVAQQEGDVDTACDLYARAVILLEPGPDRRLVGAFRAWWGSAEATRGGIDDAVDQFERARAILSQCGDAALLALDDVLLASLDLAGSVPEVGVAAVRARLARSAAQAGASVEVRLAYRWVVSRIPDDTA